MSGYMYAISLSGRWLVHAPLHFISAIVNSVALKQLKNNQTLNQTPELLELQSALSKKPKSVPGAHNGQMQPAFLGLIPTRGCNLDCVYCGFGAASIKNISMDPQMAVEAINWMGQHAQSSGKDTLEIHFFGGEPLVAWDVIEVAVHRARMIAGEYGLVPHFEVATNGVIDEKQARFLGDYFDRVVLSFDGPQKVHDRHRPKKNGQGSYDSVVRTAHLLGESPAELCFRMCVTQDSVSDLEETAAWFCENFSPSFINFETLQPTVESEAAGLNPPEPYEFAVHFVRARRVIEEFGLTAVYAADHTDQLQLSFCPVGKDTLILSPDGRISSCYLLDHEWKSKNLDMDVGYVSGNGAFHIDKEAIYRLRELVMNKPRCKSCFCQWSCAGGCHVNHSYPDCSEEYDNFCIQTRIITACSILTDLGQNEVIEDLLNDKSAMESLAMQKSDCLENWEAVNE